MSNARALLLLCLPVLLAGCGTLLAPSPEPARLPAPTTDGLKRAAPPEPVAGEIAVRAMTLVGRPYRHGGTTAEGGFDCSGFTQAVYREGLGVRLPRLSAQQAARTAEIDERDLAPGDLVFFDTQGVRFSHVGIYVGDGRFVHSPRTGASVRIESMRSRYWRSRFDGARRVLASTPGG